MADQERKRTAKPETEEVTEAAPEATAKAEELKDDLDELLDEIDEVLETNAEEFVRSYVQKGGQ
jgi:ubiquitin-like protein Pup